MLGAPSNFAGTPLCKGRRYFICPPILKYLPTPLEKCKIFLGVDKKILKYPLFWWTSPLISRLEEGRVPPPPLLTPLSDGEGQIWQSVA